MIVIIIIVIFCPNIIAFCSVKFYRGINKQLSQVVDTLFVSPIINSNNKYTLLLFIFIMTRQIHKLK
jgi:uncharacterized membrane protein YdcZ (DUF606 family)